MPEKDVYAHLIDAYRLRVEDEYTMTGDVGIDSLYGGADPTRDFRRYLNKAEKRVSLLPDWWSKEKRAACEMLAKNKSGSHCIYHTVEKSDITDLYDNPLMPMNLRMLAEKVYGEGVGGWDF